MSSAVEIERLYHTPTTLPGRYVRLIPLEVEHCEPLFDALNGDRELWQYIPFRHPETVSDMRDWVEAALSEQQLGRRLPWTVMENGSGQIIGSTSYLNMSFPNRNLEIGWTWYARPYWRTGVNTECKYLLLRYAFETLGCIRVQLRSDLRNVRSQRAMERIGGRHEAVMRKAQILYDGHQRDVAVYALIDDDWPTNKARLEAMLNR